MNAIISLCATMLKVDPLRLIGRVFPIVQWARTYDAQKWIGDLIAGITVALTLVPQSIAYASLAGFEPQYGLYASFAGGFVYALMGTCPQINIGPTALLSLLTFTYTNGQSPDYAVLLCFVGGIIQLCAGVAQLGFLVEFVSLPVVSGFTSAAAITIASSQIKGLLGLKFNAETFISTWKGVFDNIGSTKLEDTLLGLSCCIMLIGMKALKDFHFKSKDEKVRRVVVLRRSFWFAGVSRNAVVVIMASLIAYFVYEDKDSPFILTGRITPGVPKPGLPPFTSLRGNTTVNALEMFAHLGSGLIVVPLVGVISNVAIAKAFSKGKTLDATQEIVALGACNIIGAFFRSFPVNGSFSRSAVSDASGVITPAAGFYTGIIVLLTLVLLTPFFFFIPRAALAAVIVCAVLHMVDLAILKKLWKTNRLDLFPLLGTFIFCLALGIEIGLGCGVAIDVVLIVYYQSRPSFKIRHVDDGIFPPHYAVHPIGGFHFASAEKVRSQLMSLKHKEKTADVRLENLTVISSNSITEARRPIALVVHCDALCRVDFTFLQSLKMLVQEWSSNGRVVWCDVNSTIKEQLNSILEEPLYCDSSNLRIFLLEITMPTQSGGQ